jgi:mannose-1-phosphate guanylyltransferase
MIAEDIKRHTYAVIMAGGEGERFWPKSRQACPKQLLKIFGERSMIQMTADRITPLSSQERLLVITNELQAPLIMDQLPGVPESSIVAEPFGRDTAACIALAAAMVIERDPEGIMIVLPADHIIHDRKSLIMNLGDACKMAQDRNCLVTLGIKPTAPSTGYGYIHSGETIKSGLKTVFTRVREFAEKPDAVTARRYVQSGDYFWNSGMFIWKAAVIVEELKKQMPYLYEGYRKIRKSLNLPERERVIQEVYSGLEKTSIDYGVMENAENVIMARADFDWDDAGTWMAIERHYRLDDNGNAILGEAVILDSERCVIVGEEGIIGCVGIKDIVVVKTADAVLVCRRDRAQDVKKIVEELKTKKEWGRYT